MTDEGALKGGADFAAKQRKQAIRQKARELASQQGKEWTSASKEERKQFRKAARAAAPGDLSSLLGTVSDGKEPTQTREGTGSATDREPPSTGRNPKGRKLTT